MGVYSQGNVALNGSNTPFVSSEAEGQSFSVIAHGMGAGNA